MKKSISTLLIHTSLALMIAAFACRQASAQDSTKTPDMSTDRPGEWTLPDIVPQGYVQIEGGPVFGRDKQQTGSGSVTVSTASLPFVLVRIGVVPSTEIRLGAEYHILSIESSGIPDQTDRGIASLSIGAKTAICAENRLLPESAFAYSLKLPYGNATFRPPSLAPTIVLSMKNSLSDLFGLYYNLGASWDGVQPSGTGIYNLAVAAGPWSGFGAFVELYGQFSSTAVPTHSADAGVVYLVVPNFQIDLFGGAGITQNATDYFVAGGASLRLPR